MSPSELSALIAYDPETGILRWKARGVKHFDSRFADKPIGAKSPKGYLVFHLNGASQITHRIAWAIYHGAEPVGLIDHINGDRTDNRIANLRVVTGSQNNMNRRKLYGKAPHKGVRETPAGRWCALIIKDRKRHHLGVHDTAEQAARAYDDAARKMFGECAALNFPKAGEQSARLTDVERDSICPAASVSECSVHNSTHNWEAEA